MLATAAISSASVLVPFSIALVQGEYLLTDFHNYAPLSNNRQFVRAGCQLEPRRRRSPRSQSDDLLARPSRPLAVSTSARLGPHSAKGTEVFAHALYRRLRRFVRRAFAKPNEGRRGFDVLRSRWRRRIYRRVHGG